MSSSSYLMDCGHSLLVAEDLVPEAIESIRAMLPKYQGLFERLTVVRRELDGLFELDIDVAAPFWGSCPLENLEGFMERFAAEGSFAKVFDTESYMLRVLEMGPLKLERGFMHVTDAFEELKDYVSDLCAGQLPGKEDR